ncbi:MAG: RND family efflux transporter MFP subunit [Verrucomicrobiales bacterium]|jgi:RND family efflux transporter MFP subunit
MDRSNQKRLSLTLIAMLLGVSFATAEDEPLRVRTYLRPIHSIEIATTETGVIQQLLVKLGDDVKTGAPLLKLNSAVVEAQLAQAKVRAKMEGDIKAAEAEMNLAKNRYELMKKLESGGSANQAELNRGLATLQTAEGQLQATRENQQFYVLDVTRIEAQLALRTLNSPIDGVVAEVVRDEAETIGLRLDNEEPYLVRVVDISQLRAEAHVPYESASDLKVGDPITVELRTKDTPSLNGKIEFISKLVDPATGTVEVHALFDGIPDRILSGIPGFLLVP